MITVTFIRHGESMDNLRTVWAGWKDAPLSNHGMNQAKACGEYFASLPFTHIYASPLKRAHSTARAIQDAQREPKPPLTNSPDVREQHFGVAEGNPWSMKTEQDLSREEMYQRGVYPVIYDRHGKFPGGESLNDLQIRAERAINDIVVPYIIAEASPENSGKETHIAIVSHGLCISELIAAVLRLDRDSGKGGKDWTGLLNTAWSRVSLEVTPDSIDRSTKLPPIKAKVTHVNEHTHLQNIKRQRGGIGSSAHDPAQKDIRAFFGGGVGTASKDVDGDVNDSADGQSSEASLEEGRASSNAYDEVDISTVKN